MKNKSITNKYKRQPATKSYKRAFIIAPEGIVTEVQYFENLKSFPIGCTIKIIKPIKHSSPEYILKSMKSYLKEHPLRVGDEAWIVVDRDEWPEEHIHNIIKWSKEPQNNAAISNPKFEIWILSHFKQSAESAKVCDNKIEKYIKGYNKTIPNFSLEEILDAISYCKQNYKNLTASSQEIKFWKIPGTSNVYELVEKIIKSGENK